MLVKFLKELDVTECYMFRCGDGCCAFPITQPYSTQIGDVMEVSDWEGVTEESIEGLTEGEDYIVEPYSD